MSQIPQRQDSQYARFLDEYTPSIPNEGNLLSLLTLKQFYKDDENVKEMLKKVANEENQYLLAAMHTLTRDPATMRNEADRQAHQKMKDKFGKDFKSMVSLSQLLKQEADEMEFKELLKPTIQGVIKNRVPHRTGLGLFNPNYLPRDRNAARFRFDNAGG